MQRNTEYAGAVGTIQLLSYFYNSMAADATTRLAGLNERGEVEWMEYSNVVNSYIVRPSQSFDFKLVEPHVSKSVKIAAIDLKCNIL